MAKVEKFEDLRCWQEARDLVKEIYGVTGNGKAATDFGFRDQIRRAAISVINNIAEGFGRTSNKEFIRYLEFSFTSSNEVKSLLYVAIDLGYLEVKSATELQQKAEGVKAMNLALIKYLRSKRSKP
ncbi:MAG: 30S ribosomal protein S23 [Bacteroidetes bacterium OLB12]|nr:MAG: 30S ribosomal protein S23 [Bacteroidetes bacterium OLB12]